MPNIKSAMKRMKTSEKARQANHSVKRRVTTSRRKLFEAIEAGDRQKSEACLREYSSDVDKAVKKGVLKANSAARRKSQAARRMATLS
jgi:small subunit ribosomal protein S20